MSKFLNRTERYKYGNAIIAQTLANGIEFWAGSYVSSYLGEGDWYARGTLRYRDVVRGVDGDLRLEALNMVLSDCDYNGGDYTEVPYKLSGTKVKFKEVIANDRSSSVSFDTPAGWVTVDATGECFIFSNSAQFQWENGVGGMVESMEEECRDIINNVYKAVFCPEMMCEEWRSPDNADKAIARLKEDGL